MLPAGAPATLHRQVGWLLWLPPILPCSSWGACTRALAGGLVVAAGGKPPHA